MDQSLSAAVLLAGIGALLAGLGIFFWGVRHVLAARAELGSTRAEPRRQPASTA